MSTNEYKPFDALNINDLDEFNPCYWRGCNKAGVNAVSVIYFDKKGFFCNDHKQELENCGLSHPKPTLKNNCLNARSRDKNDTYDYHPLNEEKC